ncbi:MAG: SDR family oxidoreductase [Rhodospirillaceae bacterium]
MKLHGRYAVITGAGQGLGAEIAAHYVAEGASVLLCARSAESLLEIQTRLSASLAPGQRVLVQTADVADRAHVDALFDTARTEFPRIDILVNNAGIYGPMGPLEDIDWDEWVSAISINLMGTVYPCRCVVPVMRRQGYGKIINLSGGGATSPMPRLSAYATSKAGVVRFTESLALDTQADHIDVNAIAPGALATRLTDQLLAAGPATVGQGFYDRIRTLSADGGTPLSVPSSLCVWLGSAESDGITGRLLAAVWDPWKTLAERREELAGSDIYTLRRITPEDRGKHWETPK